MGDQIRTTMEADSPWDVQVEDGMVLSPTPPTIDVYPADPSSDTESGAFGALAVDMADGFWVTVRARISPADPDATQDVLLAFMDPADDLSVVQALYDDPTLGGVVADLALDSTSGFVLVPMIDGSAVHVGVLWRFLVIPAVS